ncbi:MAG: hypothetical protein ACI4EU_04010 [Butyrivibrio sp.]
MLALVGIIIIVMTIALGFAVLFKVRVEKTIPVSVMAIVFIMYVSGFCRNLKFGFYVVLVCSFLALFYMIIIFLKNRQRVVSVLSPYLLYYVLFAIWLYLNFSKRMLNEWDEFSHWGLTVKAMFNSNMFSNEPGSTIYFVDYPPGTALFQYFAMQVKGEFSEGFISIAQGMLIFSFMMPVLGELRINRKNILISLFSVLCLFILPIGFYTTVYSSLYVDAALAVIFGYIVFNCLKEKEYNFFYYFNLALACGTLCITKTSGIGLMVLAGIVVFIDNFITGRYKKLCFKEKIIRLVLDIVPFIIGAIYNAAWKIRLNALGYEAHFDTKRITFKGIIDVFSGNGEAYQQTTLSNFKQTFFGFNITTIRIGSFFSYILIFIVLVLAIYLIKAENKKRFIALGTSTIVVYLIYSFYMLLLYLFTFSSGEAERLASFDRYEYTMILGIIEALVCFLLYCLIHSEKKAVLFACLLVCIMFIVPNDIVLHLYDKQEIEREHNLRKQYETIGNSVREQLDDKDKVYIISQNSDGYNFFVLRYTLSPIHTQIRDNDEKWEDVSWNIGQPNNKGAHRRIITSDEWINYLISEEFDYVLLFNVDNQFIEEFGDLFEQEIDSGQLYLVDEEKRKLVHMNMCINP